MLILAAWWHPIIATLFAFLALILMGVILLQRGRGVGLAGAFGGAGGSTAFGSKTGDFMTKATVVIAAIFMIYAVLSNYAFRPMKAGLPTAATVNEPDLGPGAPPPTGAPPATTQPAPAPGGSTSGGSTPAPGTQPVGAGADAPAGTSGGGQGG